MSLFSRFGATFTDILNRMPGVVVSDFDTGVGTADGQSIIEGFMDDEETFIFSMMPEEIQTKLTKIEGEIIIRRARGTETSATLGITTSPTNIRLYRNPVVRLRDLTVDDEWDEFTDGGNGAITFNAALSKNDLILATYSHSKTDFILLKSLIIDLARYRCVLHQSETLDEIEVEDKREEFRHRRLLALTGEAREFAIVLKELSDLEYYEFDIHRKRKQGIISGQIEIM